MTWKNENLQKFDDNQLFDSKAIYLSHLTLSGFKCAFVQFRVGFIVRIKKGLLYPLLNETIIVTERKVHVGNTRFFIFNTPDLQENGFLDYAIMWLEYVNDKKILTFINNNNKKFSLL